MDMALPVSSFGTIALPITAVESLRANAFFEGDSNDIRVKACSHCWDLRRAQKRRFRVEAQWV